MAHMAISGLAFSGGGIRSAAFCSGVLRRLLERGIEVDYLSCVSGGGYTGTAYLDWKYREERKARMEGKEGRDKTNWHKEFFDHMAKRSGYICNWKETIKGILDTIVLSCLVILVTVIQPIIKWGSYACPVAFIIDLFFGRLLRHTTDCDVVAADGTRITGYATATNENVRNHYKIQKIERCISLKGTKEIYTILLFTVLFILFTTSYILSKLKRSHRLLGVLLRLSQYTFGSFLVLTFIPFTIYDFVVKIPLRTQLLVVTIGAIVWIVLPLLRSMTSYVLIIYTYSYVIYWRVYHGKLLGIIVYSEPLFLQLLLASGFALWLVPLVTALQERLVHVYNRWRLQKAFYHKEGLGPTGCSGIGLRDICHLWTCLFRNGQESRVEMRSLTLADLKGMKPEYLSNMVVNRWRISDECEEEYELLTMSPTGIERFDRDPSKRQFEGKLEPKDVMLSEAMATSAAARSTHMGKYDHSIEGLTRLHTILGLEMGATMVTDLKAMKNESMTLKLASYLVHILRGLPLIAVQVFHYCYGQSEVKDFESSIEVALVIFFIIHLVLAFIALIDTGAEEPGWWEKIARWFIVHISYVYFMREMFSKSNTGPMPPPVLLLSDGGHVENLGILPLLKRRLPRIVVVDGGYKYGDKFFGDSLLDALMLARTKLNCSFLSEDGHDVISDLLEKFVKPIDGKKPRYYKFKVRYERDEFGNEGEGEILLIAPRDPQKGVSNEMDGSVAVDLYPFDEPNGLQQGMVLNEDDVSDLTLCCCECCHHKACNGLSKILCNVFPHHNTANQFFTSRMFSAYHREGYRACVEANADGFLKERLQTDYCTNV